MNLQAPWYEFQNKVAALFKNDPDISVGEIRECGANEDTDYAFDIEVRKHEKFEALNRMIPSVKEFGNITLGIQLFDEENTTKKDDIAAICKAMFADNPIVDDVRVVTDQFGVQQVYVMFKAEVIQYYRDEFTDYNGLWSGLAQDIAKEIIDNSLGNLHFCTTAVNPF